MGSAKAMRSASAIVKASAADPEGIEGCEIVVVVSAVSGTTDALIGLGRTAVSGGDWEQTITAIRDKHAVIVAELGMAVDLAEFFVEMEQIARGVAMLGELSPSTLDRLQSFGERMSATIFAATLRDDGANATMVDAFHLVATDNQFGSANVDFAETARRTNAMIYPLSPPSSIPVITGYIGQSESGSYVTLGRGGSDYSGAIVAAAIDATELQIWTDVDGMFTADPRFIDTAVVLEQLSFSEAGELAYFGAKVLHPKTIRPAIEKNIPVRILNTFNPTAPGTVITNEERPTVKSVTSKKGITIVNLCSLGMLDAHGFLAKIFDAFARHEVIVDVVSTSEVSVSVTVDRDVPAELIDELRTFSVVDVQPSMAIVCIVGEGIRTEPNVLGKLFAAVGSVPVSMVSQGASKRNITFVVAESDASTAVEKVFHAFFSSTVL